MAFRRIRWLIGIDIIKPFVAGIKFDNFAIFLDHDIGIRGPGHFAGTNGGTFQGGVMRQSA